MNPKRAIAAAGLLLALVATAIPAVAAPPGNDGPPCHGKNVMTCKPDPQPSHGKDCQPHGKNADGNDDHCAAPVVVQPTPTPTPPGDVDTTGGDGGNGPRPTLPPTDIAQ